MFTGFASENTPAIQVWDFANTSSTTASNFVSLSDDCAPIQYFKTGQGTVKIPLYLPTAPIEGKLITIVNSRFGFSNQMISIFSSDNSRDGTSGSIYGDVGPGQTIRLVYSKEFIKNQISAGSEAAATGWVSLDMGASSGTNYWCVVVGGSGNTAATSNGGRTAVLGGSLNSATNGSAAVVGGSSNNATATNSGVFGGTSNNAQGSSSFICGGTSNTASATNSTAIGGSYSTTRSIQGNTVFSASVNPITSSQGTSQSALLVLGVATTDATATRLRSNTLATGTTNQVILPNNSAYTFQGTCIANVTGGSTTSGWKFEGVIKRGANAASTTLVAAVTPTVIAQDALAATWVLAITADTTNGGIAVTVTGAAATTIRWVSRIETTEVTF
jgi:hypothetical protein